MKFLLTILFLLICLPLHAQQPVPTDWVLEDQPTSTVMTISPVAAPVRFRFEYGRFANAYTSARNHTVKFGWNVNGGGGAEVSGEPGIFMGMETHYEPSAGVDWSEVHLNHIDRNGVVRRPWDVNIDNDTGGIIQVLRSSNLNLMNDDGANLLQMFPGGFILQGGATVRSVNNNVNLFSQYATTGSLIPIVKVNAANKVEVASGGAPILLSGTTTEVAGTLYLKDGTSKQVTWYTNDTCGAGFKCLRIPN